MADTRIRLTIIGGYLGSGKTTWLRHQLHEGNLNKSHIIINEAAEIPIDNTLLSGASGLSVLAGGCVCCEGKLDLLKELKRICDQRSGLQNAAQRIDHIILETSGLADPASIVTLIQTDSVLIRQIVIRETIVVADAVNALEQMQVDALGRSQIEAADQIILTKTDLVGREHLLSLAASLAAVNPAATLSAAVYGSDVKLSPIPPNTALYELPNISTNVRLPISAVQLDLGIAPDWTAFTVWLSALLHVRGCEIVRVKGLISTPAGLLLLQAVRNVIQSPEVLPDNSVELILQNKIAVIGYGFKKQDLIKSVQYFSNPG